MYENIKTLFSYMAAHPCPKGGCISNRFARMIDGGLGVIRGRQRGPECECHGRGDPRRAEVSQRSRPNGTPLNDMGLRGPSFTKRPFVLQTGHQIAEPWNAIGMLPLKPDCTPSSTTPPTVVLSPFIRILLRTDSSSQVRSEHGCYRDFSGLRRQVVSVRGWSAGRAI